MSVPELVVEIMNEAVATGRECVGVRDRVEGGLREVEVEFCVSASPVAQQLGDYYSHALYGSQRRGDVMSLLDAQLRSGVYFQEKKRRMQDVRFRAYGTFYEAEHPGGVFRVSAGDVYDGGEAMGVKIGMNDVVSSSERQYCDFVDETTVNPDSLGVLREIARVLGEASRAEDSDATVGVIEGGYIF